MIYSSPTFSSSKQRNQMLHLTSNASHQLHPYGVILMNTNKLWSLKIDKKNRINLTMEEVYAMKTKIPKYYLNAKPLLEYVTAVKCRNSWMNIFKTENILKLFHLLLKWKSWRRQINETKPKILQTKENKMFLKSPWTNR